MSMNKPNPRRGPRDLARFIAAQRFVPRGRTGQGPRSAWRRPTWANFEDSASTTTRASTVIEWPALEAVGSTGSDGDDGREHDAMAAALARAGTAMDAMTHGGAAPRPPPRWPRWRTCAGSPSSTRPRGVELETYTWTRAARRDKAMGKRSAGSDRPGAVGSSRGCSTRIARGEGGRDEGRPRAGDHFDRGLFGRATDGHRPVATLDVPATSPHGLPQGLSMSLGTRARRGFLPAWVRHPGWTSRPWLRRPRRGTPARVDEAAEPADLGARMHLARWPATRRRATTAPWEDGRGKQPGAAPRRDAHQAPWRGLSSLFRAPALGVHW